MSIILENYETLFQYSTNLLKCARYALHCQQTIANAGWKRKKRALKRQLSPFELLSRAWTFNEKQETGSKARIL